MAWNRYLSEVPTLFALTRLPPIPRNDPVSVRMPHTLQSTKTLFTCVERVRAAMNGGGRPRANYFPIRSVLFFESLLGLWGLTAFSRSIRNVPSLRSVSALVSSSTLTMVPHALEIHEQ